MSALARAEAVHYGRLDAAYQRQLDDDAAREDAIEREYRRLITKTGTELIALDEGVDDAIWAAAELLVNEQRAE
jgi:hypothetical protein